MEINYPRLKNDNLVVVKSILNDLENVKMYENSIHEDRSFIFFIIRNRLNKYLVVTNIGKAVGKNIFKGEKITSGEYTAHICQLTHKHAEFIREIFPFTKAVLAGKNNTYGFGDRLGNAGAAHLRAVSGTGFKPILAQQSIRELERTKRTAQQVMDEATWAVFQEGYHDGFGADGDHLKNFDDIDIMMEAGFTMFTIDPGDYVINNVEDLMGDELRSAYINLPWERLSDDPNKLLNRYSDKMILLPGGFELSPGQDEVMRGMIKYGHVLNHTLKMSNYISEKYSDCPSELELSVDETDEPTTLFEHYLVASELQRLGVELVSLAPRFSGKFEKGIDFKGDLKQFREEYIQHLAIAEKFGGYKLSIHSGSDKFSVYDVVGSLNNGAVHVKTAGTSYLEALRTVAEVDPGFFREILKYSLKKFETDKKTYQISAVPSRIKDPDKLSDTELLDLMNNDDARQVLHVAYGSVLSGELGEAKYYKQRLMALLETNEELHEQNLYNHFKKHLNPFK